MCLGGCKGSIPLCIVDAIWNQCWAVNICKSFVEIEMPVVMYQDNIGATYLAENDIHNKRSKHIDIRYHHVRDLIAQKIIKIEYIKTADNIADIQTKALPRPAFQGHCEKFLTLLTA